MGKLLQRYLGAPAQFPDDLSGIEEAGAQVSRPGWAVGGRRVLHRCRIRYIHLVERHTCRQVLIMLPQLPSNLVNTDGCRGHSTD